MLSFPLQNGKIVAKINGANAPLVNKKIVDLVNEERKIAAGEMVRPQVVFWITILFFKNVLHIFGCFSKAF